ncbi:hypothetical protein GOV11_00245 [Candidatus Woesearchaeota archaeon]|nr:hypothetical protein [Candidatus Woesearchaeota archaeon]
MVLPLVPIIAVIGSSIAGGIIYKRYQNNKNRVGFSEERNVEAKTGTDRFGYKLKRLTKKMASFIRRGKTSEEQITREADIEEAERKQEAKQEGTPQAKKHLGPIKKLEKAAEKNAAVAEEEEEAARDLIAIQSRGTGILAALKEIEKSVESYLGKAEKENRAERQESRIIADLGKRIGEVSTLQHVDQHTMEYLKQFSDQVTVHLDKELEIEKRGESDLHKLVKNLREAIDVAASEITSLKAEERLEKKYSKHEKRDMTKELKLLEKAIKKKEDELKSLKKSDSDPGVVEQLKREIEMLKRQRRLTKDVHTQVKRTLDILTKELRKMRSIIMRLKVVGGGLKHAGKKLPMLEENVNERVRIAEDSLKELKENLSRLEHGTNPHSASLSIGTELTRIQKNLQNIGGMDQTFGKVIVTITEKGYEMARIMVTLDYLIDGLEKTHEAVTQGIETTTKIMEAVLAEEGSEIDETEVESTLEELKQALNYGERVERKIIGITKSVEYRLRELSQLLVRFNQENTRMPEAIAMSSEELGNIMRTNVDRKIEIGGKYTPELRNFEEEFKRLSVEAARGYSRELAYR